ncbi:unnamed protein product [Brassicogethes aeneus]|uniref:Myb-binding protein 1A n=1 Tax=Brassicogethes aeneus TaxID=1431903 RepID=A0A9P0AU27_BRAAE|nr:unnamed protein product [Brassicogethes aeneus]
MDEETHVDVIPDEKPKRKVKQTVLDNFSKITNPNEKVRVKSASNLLNHLSEIKENEKDDSELKYALGRIIRGLGSSTNQARTGFYSALVGLLGIREDVSVSDLFEHVEKHLHRVGSNTKGENADVSSGQILVCGAIIRSELFYRSNAEEQKKIIELLISAGKERTYLTLVSYIFILNVLEKVTDKEAEKIVLPLIKTEILKPINEYTLDSLYFLMAVQQSKPNLVKHKLLKNAFGSDKVICQPNLSQLSNILTAIPRITSLPHPIFELFAQNLTSSEHLVEFFTELDKHLHRPNRNKHLAITTLFSHVLSTVADYEAISDLLGENFVKQTICYFKTFTKYQKDGEFQKQMHDFFEKLVATLKGESVGSTAKIRVLKRLLFHPGTFIFEKITKSKIIQHITSTLDADGVKELSDVYCDVVTGKLSVDIGPNTNERWLNNDRLYAAHLLVKLLHLPVVQKCNDWKVEKLMFLMTMGIFNKSISNVGVELANSLKDTFYGSLDLKGSKLEDIQDILTKLVKNLDEKLSVDTLETVLRNPISPENYSTWQKTMLIVDKIDRKKKRSTGIKSVFLTLFLQMQLQLLNDAKLATETLEELFNCYDRVKKSRKNSLNETEQSETSNDPLWIEVVVDLFLNLLSHNSHLLRSLIGNVFPHLCGHLNATAIHQILSVLDPKNQDNPLTNKNESDSESDGDSEEEDDESNEDSEEEESDVDEDEKQTDKLRLALHKALASNQQEDDLESIDLDQLSDSEGQKLDEALAEAFKQFKPNRGRSKKQNKDAETLTHFRVRVLDLIEIYLDSTPNMLLTLEIMLPLLQSVEFSVRDEHQKPLQTRLKSILKKLTACKKFEGLDEVTDITLCDLLKSLLEKGTKNAIIMQEMGEQISDCCIFIIKCSQIITSIEETPKKIKKHLKNNIANTISEELTNYFTKNNCLTPYVLFKSTLNLPWEGNLNITTTLLDFIYDSSIKQFKKSQALELLKIFFTNQRYLSQNPEKLRGKIAEKVSTFVHTTTDFFKDLSANITENKVKEKFLCNLFGVLASIKCCPLKFEGIHWPTLAENVREYRTHVSFSKDAKTAFNKLCNSLGVSHIVKMKQNVTKISTTTEEKDEQQVNGDAKVEKKKKNKKVNNEKLKLKKEAKSLRLQSLSEGFSSKVDFSEDKIAEDIDVEMEDSEEKKNKKKRKKKTSTSEPEEEMQEETNTKKNKKRKKKNSTSEETVDETPKNAENGVKKKNKKKKSV